MTEWVPLLINPAILSLEKVVYHEETIILVVKTKRTFENYFLNVDRLIHLSSQREKALHGAGLFEREGGLLSTISTARHQAPGELSPVG